MSDELKHQLLGLTRKVQKIELPGLPPVFMKRMSGHERAAFQSWHLSQTESAKKIRGAEAYDSTSNQAMIMSLTLCDENGARILTHKECLELDIHVIDALANAATEVNCLPDNPAAHEALEKKP